jgi:tetratricopeptide (TPR) repeat protein
LFVPNSLIAVWSRAALVAVALVVCGCDANGPAAMQRVSEGVVLASRGEDTAAIRKFEDAIALDASNAYAHYYVGLVRLQEFADAGRAVESLERASSLAPSEPEMHYQLGLAYAALDRDAEAREAFEAATTLLPTHARALHRLGQADERSGAVRDAIDRYTQAIYADPHFPWAYVSLGNIYSVWGRPQEAIRVYENGIANGALADTRYTVGHAQLRADLGRVYLELSEPELAITYLEQAVELYPQSVTHAFNLGIAYQQRLGRTGSEVDRRLALENLARARAQCNGTLEPARCSSIAAALRDLRASEDPRETP